MSAQGTGERAEGKVAPEGFAPSSVTVDRGSPEQVSTDLSDLSETERQVVRQLPAGYYYDAEDSTIVRCSMDLPECVELVTELGQRISVPTSRVVLGLPSD